MTYMNDQTQSRQRVRCPACDTVHWIRYDDDDFCSDACEQAWVEAIRFNEMEDDNDD